MDVYKRTMSMLIILCLPALMLCTVRGIKEQCVSGYMTDVQSWVDNLGSLTGNVDRSHSIDLSSQINPTPILQTYIENKGARNSQLRLKYLSMSRCELRRIPKVFNTIRDPSNRTLSSTLEYLSLFGNRFTEVSAVGVEYDVIFNATDSVEEWPGVSLRSEASIMWFNGFKGVKFDNLRELDLRACSIESLKPFQFKYMPQLEALYLGENIIHTIQANAFWGLDNLIHLDLSMNMAMDDNGLMKLMNIESAGVFEGLQNLKSLDLSHTKLSQRNIAAFRSLGKSLERLSVCNVGSVKLSDRFFKNTSLKVLDVSGNNNVLSPHLVLSGLESTLEVLYAVNVGLSNFDIFTNFNKLQILALSKNEIAIVRQNTAKTLSNLQVLDLSNNRIGSWFTPTYSQMRSLRLLNLRKNNINVISEEMMFDMGNITYLGLSGNSMVCNCRSKELIEIASKNELVIHPEPLYSSSYNERNTKFGYHRAFDDVNMCIALRKNISYICMDNACDETYYNGNILLMDYNSATYSCFQMDEGLSVPLTKVMGCEEERRITNMPEIVSGWNKLLLLCIPGILLPALFLVFTFRRNLKYFYVTMKNSAMISLATDAKGFDDDTIYNYDVFVSYCNNDRPWVLDQLLSHLETDCSISLCLHERDFQVGLTILENIVSCMDRSKLIMLVISEQFLLSQWCQFEMHLAQHRLLETRREDLILILLEEIPRRLRPNTLHYLMITKTYIVWPKSKLEQQLFWKRLKKSILSRKLKQKENESLA